MDETERIQEKVTVAPPSPEDARGIQELIFQSWLATFPNEDLGITEDAIRESFANNLTEDNIYRLEQHFAQPPEGERGFIAKKGNAIVGTCFVRRPPEESTLSNELVSLHVLPSLKRSGIGKTLWLEGEQALDPAKDTFLWVAEYNDNAIEFYKKQGFALTEERTQKKLRGQTKLFRPMIKMVKKAAENI